MMNYKTITNFNFNEVEDYQAPHHPYTDRAYGYHRGLNNRIIFEANYLACPCVYYVKKDDLFCYSFDVDMVVNFAKENGIDLTDTFDNKNLINANVRKHIKSSVTKRYKYNVNYIEGWKKITLHPDGSFDKIKNTFVPFQLDIREHYTEFKAFLIKYKKIVSKAIDDGNFAPTLTGGLDTRALLGLYKDRINDIDGYILNSIKQDGKKNVLQGQLEMKLAATVANITGVPANRYDKITDRSENTVTLSGMMNENANEFKNPNDIEYVYKVMQHIYSNEENGGSINRMIVPYLEDDYLQFKQKGELCRVLLLHLLVPELLLVPFVSGTSFFNHFTDGTTISPVLDRTIQDVQDILAYWGTEKVLHILDENYDAEASN